MTALPTFTTPDLWAALAALDQAALDRLDFGVIGFDADAPICNYNRIEAEPTGLTPARLIGKHLFEDIAQCMNNFMVAQRFDDARAAGQPLDALLDYILTRRMKPTPVALRLLAEPAAAVRHLALRRQD